MAEGGRGKLVLRVTLVLVVVVALLLGGRQLATLLPGLTERVTRLGPMAPVLFALIYAIAVVAFVPGSILSLAAGATFGMFPGLPVVFVGAALGGSLAFLIARYVARGAVERAVARNPRFAGIDRAIGRDGRRIVFLMRLSPVFPFSLLNYALGLTTVRFTDYLIACLGMLPGEILYVYYGTVAGDLASLAAGTPATRGPAYYILLGLGLVATIVATLLVTRSAKRALAEAMP
jgi:uncharacterized membrane protein YdjX (TVP38/TMEM64 family)